MENLKIQLASETQSLVISIKDIIKKELYAALNNETRAYNDFIALYKQALEKYFAGFHDFKAKKHIEVFLYKNISLNNELSEALEDFSNEKEPLFFPDAFRSISKQAFEMYAAFDKNEKSAFFSLIKETLEKKELEKTKRDKVRDYLHNLARKKNETDSENSIQSLIYVYFEQTLAKVLKENESALFKYYELLAELSQNLWDNFNKNTAFVQKLDKVKYDFEKLDASEYNWELDLNIIQNIKEIENKFQQLTLEIEGSLETTILDFDLSILLIQKATVLSKEEILRGIDKYYNRLKKSKSTWRITRMALAEDWCLDLEILTLKYQIIQEYFGFIQSLNSSFNTPFYKNLEEFETQFAILNGYFNQEAAQDFNENPQAILQKLKLQLKKELLIKSLPSLKNQLNNPALIGQIDAFENLSENSFSSISENRELMKTPDYLREVKKEELESISPLDLISFEIKPHFIRVFPAFKRAIIAHTQTLLNEIETAPNIAIFSIESASMHFEDNKQLAEVIAICKQGIKSSITKVQETKLMHEGFIKSETEKLSLAIDNMASSIIEITNNESAFKIKMRIVRAKALIHSKEIRDRIVNQLFNSLPILISKLKLFYQFIEDSSRKIAKQFAFDKTQNFISTDISDFLSTTQSAITKLPYVYQRLFSFEPLETFDLYIERKVPMDMLNLAYSKWKEEKFTPVVLIGEKGSGKTTFIRKFIKSTISNEAIFLFDLIEEKRLPSEHYQHIIDTAKLNNHISGEKKIIAIDGLERLFETKINGFENLLKLFEVISDTRKDIFWLVSVHSISWAFFEKSIQASHYFAYHIRLNDLEYDELVELIVSRHNLSGYKITFEDQLKKKGLLNTKSYEVTEQQEILRKNYFNDMNKNVQGNILQAYLYWMRSSQLIDNSTIFIKTDNTLNFDFVRSIPPEKLLLLKSILVHNGIDAQKLSEVFRVNLWQSELQLKQLSDDGILSYFNNTFYINPLIYKQLIVHLQNINLLH